MSADMAVNIICIIYSTIYVYDISIIRIIYSIIYIIILNEIEIRV